MITIKLIDKKNAKDINIPNEPFSLWGKFIPSYINEKWSYEILKYQKQNITQMCFPDENYDYDKLCQEAVFLGAYDNGRCIGLAILKKSYLKYLYLYDLKVNKEYRNQGVGSKLIEKAKRIAIKRNYKGLYTQGQDNNLSACLFYLNKGFRIGGLDTDVYKGTSQEGKSDIIFYLDC